jgi:hypothetical protein
MFLFSGIAGLVAPSMPLVATCGGLICALAAFCCCFGLDCVGRYANLAGGFAFRLLPDC